VFGDDMTRWSMLIDEAVDVVAFVTIMEEERRTGGCEVF
jgi:FlaA1/EpsC-like NDP-sugar epimerase